MEKWFADDTYFKTIKDEIKPNIFLFGGVLISHESEKQLIKVIETIKSEYTHPNLPIKWNFRDKNVKEIYENCRRVKEYEKLLSDSFIWRKKIVQNSLPIDYKLFISCIENFQVYKTEQKQIKSHLSSYLFANALMRVGYNAFKYKPNHTQIILDWPSDNNPKPFNDEYLFAFNEGVTCDRIPYYSGNLKSLGFEESIFFARCIHSTLLQFTDLIIGAFKDFLEAHLRQNDNSFGKEIAEIILCKFDGYPNNIKGRGVNVSSKNIEFKCKIYEILKKYAV